MDSNELQKYMAKGVATVVSDVIRATLKNPRQSVFMAKFARSAREASRRRLAAQERGEHIPTFLIASITSSCNLHCAGCYARHNQSCSDEAPDGQLTGDQWDQIFGEAEELGISFILLAGGEPLLREDVIAAAAKHERILFPIFTNGYYVSERYLDLFDRRRNLLPVISIEGDEAATDARRGAGVYRTVQGSMDTLRARGLIFGVSVTVTTENMQSVYSREFLDHLAAQGCKAVIYVEYVPVSEESKHLAPGDAEREFMQARTAELREQMPEMVFLSFPGDEKALGGCVAAGRSFFHINSRGGAEPCPFSPYSDTSVVDQGLANALRSPLFRALRDEGLLFDEHEGGCVLFEKRDRVEAILARSAVE